MEKKKLELNKETIRRLRKRDLEEVVGGTIAVSLSCGVYCPEYPDPVPAVIRDEEASG
jgi:hypothetical protein